jgi:hypothetical protein
MGRSSPVPTGYRVPVNAHILDIDTTGGWHRTCGNRSLGTANDERACAALAKRSRLIQPALTPTCHF